MHEHGTINCFWGGCRMLPCRAAAARYNLARIKARKAGDWQGYVPGDKARAHLKRFRNMQAVADVSGMNASFLCSIKRGERKQIRAATEKRILAVALESVEKQRELFASNGVLVPAGPIRRMVRELEYSGFTRRTLGAKLKLAGDLRLNGKTVRAWNAMRIERFHKLIMAEAA